MEDEGWQPANSGGGCEWYVKRIILPDGREGFMAITNAEGCSLPSSLNEEVLVGYYDSEMVSYREGELDWRAPLSNVNLRYTRGGSL